MKIYNTLTGKKEEFKPLTDGEVGIYACGPTVYNYIHIGNARPACVFDTLRRYLISEGFKVTFVQNFTDIDDKIIKKAGEEGLSAAEVSQRFIVEYKKDAAGLNIRPADVHPKVTENIDSIIEFIKRLIARGYAYESGGDVYFKTRAFKEYGKLSHMPLEELEAGARVDVSESKNDPMDFALWKNAKQGEPFWPSPFGNGRPGWHIECSAMATSIFGDTVDIHCGGQDLVFPHHENEIAQSECATGKPFARFWMHNGYLNIDNKKMSKSSGNFFTVREVSEKFGYEPIRYLMISAHYRSPISYSEDVLKQCTAGLQRLYNCKEALERKLKRADVGAAPATEETLKICESRWAQFREAMEDDLNTADALAALFELSRDINTALASEKEPSSGSLAAFQTMMNKMSGILGLLYSEEKNEIPEDVAELLLLRQKAREARNFAESDRLRDEIAAKGYVVKDTKDGQQLQKG